MNIQPVSSSTVSGIGYDPATLTLEVHFNNGSIYQYFDVPQNVYDQFRTAPSAGQFLAQNIRNAYRYMRV